MKKLLILAVFVVMALGARMSNTEAITLTAASAGADPNKLFFNLSGVTKSQDINQGVAGATASNPASGFYGGQFAPFLGAEGPGFLDPTTGSVAGGDAVYGETWGIMKVSSILDELAGVRWASGLPGFNEDLYLFFFGLFDKNITPTITGVNIDSVGGIWQMWESKDLVDTDEYGILGGPANRGLGALNLAQFNTITNISDGTLFLSGIFGPGIDLLDPDVTVDQDVDFATAPATGDGTGYGDILGGTAMLQFDTDSFTDTYSATHDLFFLFNVEPPTTNQFLAGWDQKINDPISANIVPEPTTVVLLGIGLLGMVGVAARKRKSAKK